MSNVFGFILFVAFIAIAVGLAWKFKVGPFAPKSVRPERRPTPVTRQAIVEPPPPPPAEPPAT